MSKVVWTYDTFEYKFGNTNKLENTYLLVGHLVTQLCISSPLAYNQSALTIACLEIWTKVVWTYETFGYIFGIK